MFKHTYDSMNRVIVPSRELEQATLEQMAARRAGGRMPWSLHTRSMSF